jgi:DNA-binding NarL/FixJ family response regulator
MQYTDERKYITVAAEPFSPPGASGTQLATGRRGHSDDMQHTAVSSVLLVDDHALMREGLRQLLTLEPDIQVVGDAVDGIDALQKIRQLRPDVVLMDIHLPIADGLVVTQHIVQEFPEIAVLILTMYQQNQHVLQAMKSGAKGYLLKTSSVHQVAEAISTVRAGGVFVAPEMAGMIVGEYRRLSTSLSGNEGVELLHAKEVEIVRYVKPSLPGVFKRECRRHIRQTCRPCRYPRPSFSTELASRWARQSRRKRGDRHSRSLYSAEDDCTPA